MYLYQHIINNIVCIVLSKSASCTPVSALLQSLSALHSPSAFEPPMQEVDSDDESLPCTSQPCRWKSLKKRKENTLCLADATFVKNDYAKLHKPFPERP